MLAFAKAMSHAVDDPARLTELDLSFHLLLAQASLNPLITLIIRAFQGTTRQASPLGWKSRPTVAPRDLTLATRIDIARAVAASDPQQAVASMSQDFDEIVRALLPSALS